MSANLSPSQNTARWLSHRLLSSVAIVVTIALTGCTETAPVNPSSASPDATTSADRPQGDRPTVVASYSVLCDLTERIAGETVEIVCLAKGGTDPHTFRATPTDRKAIESAQLVLYGGYNFDSEVINLVKATQTQTPKIPVNELAVPEPLMGTHSHDHGEQKADGDHDHSDHGHSDHNHGDQKAESKQKADGDHDHSDHSDHAESGELVADPHIWHDPKIGVAMVKVIRDKLKTIAPENAELYDRNAQTLVAELTQIDSWIANQIATIPANQRKLVTTHEAMGYYGRAYDLEILGTLQGMTTAQEPTASRLRELVSEIQAAQVPTIFAETTANDQVLATVAREAGVKLSAQRLYADGLGEAGGPAATYTTMLVYNTCTIVEGLGGQCQPFTFKP